MEKLLKSFVHEGFVKHLDFSSMESLDKSFIDENFKKTESDKIYKIRYENRDLFLYLLMEFQSTSDLTMPLRFLRYLLELSETYGKDRKALPVISLTDSAHITCVGNDYGFDKIFSRCVEAYGKSNDFFICFSTSGNYENIKKALHSALKVNMKTLSLLGKDGGALKGISDFEFIIPGLTSDRIQKIHMIILHTIIEGVERIIFPELY